MSHPYTIIIISKLNVLEKTMNKFTTNQFAEDTTAAEIYEMREEHRRAESELMMFACLRILRWDAEQYED